MMHPSCGLVTNLLSRTICPSYSTATFCNHVFLSTTCVRTCLLLCCSRKGQRARTEYIPSISPVCYNSYNISRRPWTQNGIVALGSLAVLLSMIPIMRLWFGRPLKYKAGTANERGGKGSAKNVMKKGVVSFINEPPSFYSSPSVALVCVKVNKQSISYGVAISSVE